MPYVDVPAIMQKIAAASPTTGRDALRFTVYNAVRSNETRFAVWTEFDLENAIWTIPGERMTARETHVVPLSAPAVAPYTVGATRQRHWLRVFLGRQKADQPIGSAHVRTPVTNETHEYRLLL